MNIIASRKETRRFLIEWLGFLCVLGGPVHVPRARNREKRLKVGSKSAPSGNVTIASSMPSVQFLSESAEMTSLSDFPKIAFVRDRNGVHAGG